MDVANLYRRAINKFGLKRQLDKAVEEAAELIVEVRHFQRGRVGVCKVQEEAADIMIMAEQIRQALGPEEFDRIKREKLERLKFRLDRYDR
jgi:NTP pyrophosphatase (non-canonical NTP hydrolase)